MTTYATSQTMRRVGYGFTIAINLLLLWIANNLLAWGWFPWLTEEFEQVLPAINASLAATAVASLVYWFYDPKLFKKVVDLIPTFLSLRAAISLWRVYPFDFSAYEFNWDAVARTIIAIAIVGTGIGLVVSAVAAFRAVVKANDRPPPEVTIES